MRNRPGTAATPPTAATRAGGGARAHRAVLRTRIGAALVCGAAVCLATGGTAVAQAKPAEPRVVSAQAVQDLGCATAEPGQAHCMGELAANLLSDGTVRPKSSATPTGLGPDDIRSAYSLTGTSATGTVAIVDAYDDPKAEQDLAVYRSQYGLPACTSANGCFTKVNQNGAATPLPRADRGWAEEISLDLDAVSAACPSCKILLVEARSAAMADLGTAVNTAAAHPGVAAVSNSYGGNESSANTTNDRYYNHPGVAITASSGDSGYGVEYPAASRYVTAVGGTTLTQDPATSRGWSETAWSGSGSGCSAYEPKPAWQTDSGCTMRTVADVAADSDPASGLAIYDSYHQSGWLQVGGTSLASPIIASVYALAGNTATIKDGSYPYTHTGALNDITTGTNGPCGTYLCTAGPGYDGPTGLGTPNGTGAF